MRGPAAALVLVALVSATALFAPAAALAGDGAAGGAARCGNVPCGYIYPLIVIEAEGARDGKLLPKGEPLVMDATLTFKFDALNEGFTASDPTKPIEITFEFPRKPGWANVQVEPNLIEVPITPQYLEPDADDPNSAEMWYRWSTDITITFEQKDTPLLEAGRDYAKLLVFAKSSESGLYKPSYGIKEFRVTPEGAQVATDAAANYVDAAPTEVPEVTRAVGDARLTLTALEKASPFRPTPFRLAATTADGAPVENAYINAGLVDATGRLLYSTGPRHVTDGDLHLNLTLPGPGRYRVVATAEPTAQSAVAWPAATVAFPVAAGPLDADAVRLTPEYRASYAEVVSEAAANAQDPASQYEKRIPFPVYDGANGAAFAFYLATRGPNALQGPTGAANLNVEVLDPNGATVATGSFDPANPTLRMPVSGLPGEGLYHVRVFGAGGNADALAGAAYDVEMAVTYDDRPIVAPATEAPTGLLPEARHGALTVRGPADALDPWTPTTVPLQVLDGEGRPVAGDAEALVSITDAKGNLVHTTGWVPVREGAVDAPVTLPAGGVFHAHVTTRSGPGDEAHWQPVTLTVPLVAGDLDAPSFRYPAEYVASYVDAAPLTAVALPGGATYAKTYPLPVLQGATEATATLTSSDAAAAFTVELVAPDGSVVDSATAEGGEATVTAASPVAGEYAVRVAAEGSGAEYALDVRAAYPAAPTAVNPLYAAPADAGETTERLTPLPGALALLALAAPALARRRRA